MPPMAWKITVAKPVRLVEPSFDGIAQRLRQFELAAVCTGEPDGGSLMTSNKTPDGSTGDFIAAVGHLITQAEVPNGGTHQAETFRDVAIRLREHGFVIMPVQGKAAFVKNFSVLWLQDQSTSTISKWVASHGDCNTGLCLGEVVAIDIDIDDPSLADEMHSYIASQLGESPFVRFGRQPRRVILYRVKRLYAEHLLKGWSVGATQTGKVELLGPGKQVVIFGTHPNTGTLYFWPNSSPLTANIDELPWTTVEDLDELKVSLKVQLSAAQEGVKSPTPSRPSAQVKGGDTPVHANWSLDYLPEEGERGDFLYWYAREKAAEYQTEAELAKDMIAKNATFSKPQSEAEVHATARSTWKQKQAGRLRRSGKNAPAVLPVSREDLASCVPDLSPHACKLYLLLVATRDNRKAFTIPQQATANHLNMGKPTLVGAIKTLITNGLVEAIGEQPKKKQLHRGAKLYRFL